jgi:hypothetical protein
VFTLEASVVQQYISPLALRRTVTAQDAEALAIFETGKTLELTNKK